MTLTFRKLVFTMVVIVACERAARADVDSYSIFKVANYHQVDATQPASVDAPDAYYFGAQLFADTTNEIVDNAAITSFSDSVTYQMTGNPWPTAFYYNSPYYADKTSFDSDFPNSYYQFSVNDGDDTGLLISPVEDLYTSVVPYFTGDTWSRLQAVDASQPLKLCWNSFIPNPDATSAYIFVRILDPIYDYAYTTNFLSSDLTNVCVPADTLDAGVAYTLQILFSDRADDVDYGFSSDAPATVGFDVLTYTSLITIPEVLSIAPGTNAVVISWPVSGSFFGLLWTPQLSQPDWYAVTNTVTVTNNQNVVIVPTDCQAKFFKLFRPPFGP